MILFANLVLLMLISVMVIIIEKRGAPSPEKIGEYTVFVFFVVSLGITITTVSIHFFNPFSWPIASLLDSIAIAYSGMLLGYVIRHCWLK